MRRLLLLTLILLLLFALPISASAINLKTGDASQSVILLQRRLQELDYFHFKPTGIFGGMTRTAVMRFQENNDLTGSGPGVVDDTVFTLVFAPQMKRNPVPAEVKIPIGPALKGAPAKVGEKVPWSTIKGMLRPNMDLRVSDFNTDKSYTMRFVGGENHAEVECASSSDYTAYISTFGGEPNWSKRPVIVTLGVKSYAASLQGMPRGANKTNETNGRSCLYFFESTSDILGLPDAEHDANIERAATVEH